MNTLQILKLKRPNDNMPQLHHYSISPNNTRIVKRKVPKSRLSYLKKLFCKNINTNHDQASFESNLNNNEKQVFDKSNIMVHSNKNFNKLHYRQIVREQDELSDQEGKVLRYKRFNGKQILRLGKQQDANSYKKQILSNDCDLCLSNSGNNSPKNQFVPRNQKSQSQLNKPQYYNENHIHNSIHHQRSSKNKVGNYKMMQPQNHRRVKQEIQEIKKVGRLLEDIKYQILKNRSMIIQGIKQIKTLTHKNSNQNQLHQIHKVRQKFSMGQQEQRDEIRSFFIPQRKEIALMRNSGGTKPIVQYAQLHKIR